MNNSIDPISLYFYTLRFDADMPTRAMSGSATSGMSTLKRFTSLKIVALIIFTVIIVSYCLIPLDSTSNIITPYWSKASDLWTGEAVLSGREAARGALVDVGLKEIFRSQFIRGLRFGS